MLVFPRNIQMPRAGHWIYSVFEIQLQRAQYYCARSSEICAFPKSTKHTYSFCRLKCLISYVSHWICWKHSAILGKIEILLKLSTQTHQITPGAIIIDIWRADQNRNFINASTSRNAFICRLKISERAWIMRNLRPARIIFDVLWIILMLWNLHHPNSSPGSQTHIFATNLPQTAKFNVWLLNGDDFASPGRAFVGNYSSSVIFMRLISAGTILCTHCAKLEKFA